MNPTENCKWLHKQLEALPLIRYPFAVSELPADGIYFFYEEGETWGHGGKNSRIVRVGTHKNGNFKSRIKDHFVFDDRKMQFDSSRPAPRERSIFRKNIGRALLNRENNKYLKIWEIDFTSRATRDKYKHLRKIKLEKKIEADISKILRTRFSFRFVEVQDGSEVIGREGLESNLIGTLFQCQLCKPSKKWLGLNSPVKKIRDSGLWLYQHLKDEPLNAKQIKQFERLVKLTERNQSASHLKRN
jgi:hypothetical protein